MRKILLLGALFFVLAVLGMILMRRQFLSDAPTSSSIQNGRDAIPTQAADQVSVTITDAGFSPRGIHVKRGGMVTWVNSTNEHHWPASNIHPTHEIYPEFDPERPLAPGEHWSFTFDREGLWFYHDHLESQHLGTIKVGE